MKPNRWIALTASLCLALGLVLPAGAAAEEAYPGARRIVLSSVRGADGGYTHSAVVDGTEAEEFDYVWHADPSEAHSEVKNAPAEYYTGAAPDTDAAVYIAHDVFYFPELEESGFKRVNYDGEQEWAYYYTDGENDEYIFALLPVQGSGVPTDMMHSAAEAYDNAVLHITEPGAYLLEGEWHGQIWIDLGDQDETFADENAKVTVILNGVDVACTVAPAIVFYSVYEADNAWEAREAYGPSVDTSGAGANVIIADGTVNTFNGANIYRMLRTKYKDEASTAAVKTQKKQRKTDGAFYSYVSMNIDGEAEDTGVLSITSSFEGLDSELHLTVNGGNIRVYSQDDGINVNEDGVSVVTVNGGSVHILAGLGNEGDGIDSNGYLVVNGGTLVTMANPRSDSGMDSDAGTYVNGGTVVALGSTMDWAESDGDGAAGDQAAMNLQFASSQSADETIIVTDTDGRVIFAYDPDQDEVAGENARWYTGAIISAPGIEVGKEYFVYVGGDVNGTETAGVYDAATVAGFTDAARQQCWSATGDLGGFGPGRGGRGGPGGFDPGRMGEPPEGFDPDRMGERPERGERPDGPGEGFDPGRFGEGFEDFGPPRPGGMFEGFDPDRMGGFGPGMGGMTAADGNGTREFAMEKRVNGFTGVTDYTGEAAASGGYADVSAEDWYYDGVSFVTENGLMDGVGAGRFDPSGETTRGMVMTVLARMDGADTSGGAVWYEKGLEWSVANGISDGSAPERPVTREELATMLYRYEQLHGGGFTGAWMFLLNYGDTADISAWADEALHWCAMKGIVSGYEDGSLRPAGAATRAEAAAMLARFCNID